MVVVVVVVTVDDAVLLLNTILRPADPTTTFTELTIHVTDASYVLYVLMRALS